MTSLKVSVPPVRAEAGPCGWVSQVKASRKAPGFLRGNSGPQELQGEIRRHLASKGTACQRTRNQPSQAPSTGERYPARLLSPLGKGRVGHCEYIWREGGDHTACRPVQIPSSHSRQSRRVGSCPQGHRVGPEDAHHAGPLGHMLEPTLSSTRFRRAPMVLLPRSLLFSMGVKH